MQVRFRRIVSGMSERKARVKRGNKKQHDAIHSIPSAAMNLTMGRRFYFEGMFEPVAWAARSRLIAISSRSSNALSAQRSTQL